jgi:myo-inositol catabolism protein IolC
MKLDKILKEMDEQTLSGDWEAVHKTADNLLVEVIKNQISSESNVKIRRVLKKILQSYEKVGKWYS